MDTSSSVEYDMKSTQTYHSQSGLIAEFLSNRFIKRLFLQSKIFATDKKHFMPTQGRKTSEKRTGLTLIGKSSENKKNAHL